MDLHSTMLLLYRHARAGMRWRIYIYIPLCFYFIAYRDNCPDAYVQFTFHYASTLSYARTPEFADLFNLHSTMLLLYLISLMLFTRPFFIYIPLCFYFIPDGRQDLLSGHGIYIPLCFYFIRKHILSITL